MDGKFANGGKDMIIKGSERISGVLCRDACRFDLQPLSADMLKCIQMGGPFL